MAINLGDAIGYIRLNIENFEAGISTVEAQTKMLDTTIGSLGNVFSKFGQIAVAALEAVAAATAAAVTAVTHIGSAFESAMSSVAATMGMTADEIANNSEAYQKLTDAAKEMGATTKFTATEAAEALNYLALAGYNAEESIEMLPKVLNLAAAGGMDLARASDMVTDAMSALGLSIDEADSFIDSMAKTAQSSNTSVAQLGDAILQIGGTAKSLAGGVTELDTALGILANNGIKAAEGGTALRQIILNLTAPTEKAAKYMESLGFSVYDAEGNMKPLNEAFRDLDEIISQMNTQQEKDSVLTNIFDARQLKSARALLANYGDEWDELADKIENSAGAASIMAKTMQQNFAGAMTIAQSALEAVANTAYEGLQKNFTKAAQEAIKIFERLNETLQSPQMQKALNDFSAALGDIVVELLNFAADTGIPAVIKFISNLKEEVSLAISVVKGLAVGLPILIAGLTTCEGIVGALTTKFLAMNAAMLANPWTWVALGVAALVAAASELANYLDNAVSNYEKSIDKATAETKAFVSQSENLKNAYAETKQEADDLAHSHDEEIEKIQFLTGRLGEYANKTDLSNQELYEAQKLIDELNELYPENTAYIKDGQIVAYDDLTQSVYDYCDALYWQTQAEAAVFKKNAAMETKAQAEEQLAALEEEVGGVENLSAAYEDAMADIDEFKHYQELKKNLPKDTNIFDVYGEDFEHLTQADIDAAEEMVKNGEATWNNVFEKRKDILAEQWGDIATTWSTLKQTIDDANTDIEESDARLDKILNGDTWGKNKVAGNMVAENTADAEDTADEVIKTEEDMWDRLDELDNQRKLGRIASDEEFHRLRQEALSWVPEDQIVDYSRWATEMGKEIDWVADQQEKADKEEAQRQEDLRNQALQDTRDAEAAREEAAEQARKDREREIEDLELAYELGKITAEKMYAGMEEVLAKIPDKTSDEWRDLNAKIEKGRKKVADDTATAETKAAETAFKEWSDSYNDIIDKHKKMVEDVLKDQETMTNRLIGDVDMYTKKTKQVWDATKGAFVDKEVTEVSSKALKKQSKELDDYLKTLDKLKAKGISDELMSKILGMDPEQAAEFAKGLDKMSATELATYDTTYQGIIEKSTAFAEQYYSDQLDKAKTFTDSELEVIGTLPEGFEKVGQDSIDGFIQGLEDKKDDSNEALNTWLNGVIAESKNTLGVHSPSTVYAEIGENLVQGLIEGVTNLTNSVTNTFATLGELAGNAFRDRFQLIWDGVINSVKNSLASIFAWMDGTSTMSTGTLTPMSATAPNALTQSLVGSAYTPNLTKAEIVSAIQEAMPSGDVVFTVGEHEFGRISRSSLNTLGIESGDMGLKV